MNQNAIGRPTLVFRFWQVYAILGAPLFVIYTVDSVLHPFAPEPTLNSVAFHFLNGIIGAPLIVALGILCIRRAPGNLVGLLVIALGYGSAVSALRGDFATPTLRVLLGNFQIVLYWLAFLLIPVYFPNGRVSPLRFERLINWLVLLCIIAIFIVIFADQELSLGLGNDLSAMRVINPLYIPSLSFLRQAGLWAIFSLILYSIPSSYPTPDQEKVKSGEEGQDLKLNNGRGNRSQVGTSSNRGGRRGQQERTDRLQKAVQKEQ